MAEKENLKIIIEKKYKNVNLRTFVMLGVIVFLIITNWTSCESNRNNKKKYEQNQEAFKKEIVIEQNKNGDLQTSIVSFEGKVKDLANYSQDLADEVKNLKNRKPKIITKFKTIYQVDTFIVENTVVDTFNLDKDEYRLSWEYNNIDSTRFLEGNSIFKAIRDGNALKITPGITSITRDEMSLDFVVGVAKNKKTGFDEIFVTPKNKNVTIGKLEGAIISNNKKLGINISLSGGYGAVYTGGQLGLGPFIGLTISKPIIKL